MKVWVVVDEEADCKILAVVEDEDQACEWIDKQADRAKIERAGFGIDGPYDLPLEIK